MSLPAPVVLASGSAGPLGAASFGTVTTGTTSATILAEVWNAKGSPSTDTAMEVCLSALARGSLDTTFNLTNPAIANGYLQVQVTGIAAGGTGAIKPQVTGWQRLRPGLPLRLDPIPGDSGRTITFRLVVPAGQLTDNWTFNFGLSWAMPTTAIPGGPWSAGLRGVFDGCGDGNSRYLIAGGALTPSGTPDEYVNWSDLQYRYLGAPHVLLAGKVAPGDTDGAAVALTAGQAYWAALTAGAGPGLTVTKGLLGTAPVPLSARPALPAGEELVGFVQVPFSAAIDGTDIDQTDAEWGGWMLYGQSGLAAQLGRGSGLVGDSVDVTQSAVALTFPGGTADVRVWKVPSNPDLVIAAPPRPDPQSLELWRCVTSGGAITSAVDVRPWLGPDRQRHAFRFAGTLVVAQVIYLTLPGPEDRAIALPYPVAASCDPVAVGTGSNVFEIEWWNGIAWVTLFTSSGTQDRRPTLAGAGPFTSQAALPEVLVLPGFSQVRVRVVSISAPSPTGAEIVLVTERA